MKPHIGSDSNCLNWKFTAMIILHFHLQPQYKYELFHTNFTSFHCTGRDELNKLTSLPMSFSRLRDSRSFNLTQLCAGRFYENRLVAREVVERQLNHNMTFQVAVQKLTSLGVKFEIPVTTGSPSYFKSRPNGWYTVTERIHERL